jgi:hypothetical protein
VCVSVVCVVLKWALLLFSLDIYWRDAPGAHVKKGP